MADRYDELGLHGGIVQVSPSCKGAGPQKNGVGATVVYSVGSIEEVRTETPFREPWGLNRSCRARTGRTGVLMRLRADAEAHP